MMVYMNKLKQILFVLAVTSIITIIAGCVGNGDIKNAIDTWNKIKAKQEQFEIAWNNAASSFNTNSNDLNDLKRSAQQSNNFLQSAQKLVEEEDSLISEFSETTVKLTGDAKKYANDVLINIREAHNNHVKAVSELQYLILIRQDATRAIESADIDKSTALINDMKKSSANIVTYQSKYIEYYSRANDAMEKLKALQ